MTPSPSTTISTPEDRDDDNEDDDEHENEHDDDEHNEDTDDNDDDVFLQANRRVRRCDPAVRIENDVIRSCGLKHAFIVLPGDPRQRLIDVSGGQQRSDEVVTLEAGEQKVCRASQVLSHRHYAPTPQLGGDNNDDSGFLLVFVCENTRNLCSPLL